MQGLIRTSDTPRSVWRFWLGIGLSLICLIWLISTTDWAGTWASLARTNYGLVLMAAVLNLLSIPVRTVRWRLIFSGSYLPSFGRLTTAMLVGQAVNVIAPARLGDLVRAALVSRKRTIYVLGTLVVQSTLDLLMLAGFILFLLTQAVLPTWWRGSGWAVVATAAVALTALGALVVSRNRITAMLTWLVDRWPYPWAQRILAAASQFHHSLDILGRPALLLSLLLWSSLIWTLYVAVNYVLLEAVGEQPSVLTACLLLIVLQLGVAVPSSPGRVGVYHYLGVQALAVFGVSGAQALSYIIILHLISVVIPTMLGAALLFRGVNNAFEGLS